MDNRKFAVDVGLHARLRREMPTFGGLLVTLSNLSPTISVFIVATGALRFAGSGVFLAFSAAALLGVFMAMVYAELGSVFPHSGGEYTILSRVIGPIPGFAMLALNLMGGCVALALSGLGVASYLRAVWPEAQPVATAVIVLASVTLASILSIRTNAFVTGLFLALDLAALLLLTCLGFLNTRPAGIQLLFHPVVTNGIGELDALPPVVWGMAFSSGIYAFNGYGSAIFFGEELLEGGHAVVRAVYGSLSIAVFAILLPVAGVIAGAEDFALLSREADPVLAFIRAHVRVVIADAMSLCIATAIFNGMITFVLVNSRQLFAAARDGVLPPRISRLLAKVHPRFGSPWTATLTVGVCAVPFCLLPQRFLVLVLGNGSAATYVLLCVAVVVGRRTGLTVSSKARMPLYPLAPLVVIIAVIGLLWVDLTERDTGLPGFLTTIAMLAVGATYYLVYVRRRRNISL